MKLNRQDRPPRVGPELWIRRLKASETLQCTIISASLWGCMTHWNGRSTEPCYESKKECPGHKRGLPTRWKGYLHVWDEGKAEECFLELTPVAADNLLAQVMQGEPLRGQRLKVERLKGNKARLRVTLLAHYTALRVGRDLPPPKDPHNTLCKLWGLSDVVVTPMAESVIPLEGAG